MRRKMIAGNWKMNNNQAEASNFISSLETWLSSDQTGKKAVSAVSSGEIEIVLAPSFTSIGSAVAAKSTNLIQISAQNVHHKQSGAYTGEVSLPMLEDAGCKYVIIGHSERRHVFGEDFDLLEKKLIATLESRVLPIFCVGELLEERTSGNMKKVLSSQLDSAWNSLTSDVIGEMVVIAYEPVWAIGTGQTASDSDAEYACDFIRTLAYDKFGIAASDSLRILYGGSVKPENSASLLSQSNIDGLLIGGASLEVEQFERIITSAL
ncbi:MAG: triose-phosphate isomerase [Synergistaceae bacterium]|jgi:triosephosphate isomerase|nr:triose-phosphate isomerase [Synergistaceae bacterium]